MVLNMSSILLILFILSPVSQAIWENLYQHQKVTPPPLLKRRSSTDHNGEVILNDDDFIVNSVTPKSFSEIFLGSPDTSTNLVLVKKPPPAAAVDFVPLQSTEENLHLTPQTVAQDVMFVTPNSIERPTPTTLRPVAPSAAPAIVVLSRDRYIHRPDNDFLLVTPPPKPKPKTTTTRTTTPRPATVSSTAGVPASGNVPKSWSIANYDPRKKEEWSVNRKHDFSSDDHFSPTTRMPRTFVTPKTEANRMHQPATTSEAIIERLRKDYKKRQEFIEKMQSHRDILVTPAPNVISRGSDTTTAASTTATSSYIPPKEMETDQPYTKGPSIRFMEQTDQPQAEDRSYYVTPKPSHQYQNSIVPGATTAYQEISTNPPIVLGETHFQLVESYPTTSTTPKPTTSYLTPTPPKAKKAYATTTTTVKPFNAIIPLSTSTTTYPPLTSKVFAYQLPTSLTPPIIGGDDYIDDPVATTQTSLVTTTGAIILPKNNLGYEQYSPAGYVAPTVILLQPQPSIQRNNAPDNVTPPPPQQDEDITVNATTTDPGQRLTYNTTKEPVIKMIEDEITERLQGSGEVNVSLNDTHLAQKGGEVQQSINLKINVYVENDSNEGQDNSYEPLDSLPKASTVPSIQSEQWKEPPMMAEPDVSAMLQALMLDEEEDTKAAPLTYTSSNSFRKQKKKNHQMPSPATPDDYLYDSELTIDDDFYYYEDDFPEVQLTRTQKNVKEVDLTDLELFELYDDLSDIIVEVEAALDKKIPERYTTTTTPRPSLAPQRIYNYIASKPLKKRPPPPTRPSIVPPFSSEELLEPIEQRKRPTRPPPMKKKRRPRRRRPANILVDNSLSPRGYNYEKKPDDFYKLTKDLIPDLQDVAKPLNWNVRDFSQWEKLLSSPPLPRAPKERKVEGDVTFDKLLQRDPRKLRPKFSRLIGHDAYRRRSYDDFYDNDAYKLSKRIGRLIDTSSHETAFHPLPTFDISFEDWLSESGVMPGRRTSYDGGFFHHRPESYFYRRRRR